MKYIFFKKDTERQADVNTTKLLTRPQIICNSLTKIVIMLITESTRFIFVVNVISPSDFSVKVKDQAKGRKQMERRTGTARGTCSTLIDFKGSYRVAH